MEVSWRRATADTDPADHPGRPEADGRDPGGADAGGASGAARGDHPRAVAPPPPPPPILRAASCSRPQIPVAPWPARSITASTPAGSEASPSRAPKVRKAARPISTVSWSEERDAEVLEEALDRGLVGVLGLRGVPAEPARRLADRHPLEVGERDHLALGLVQLGDRLADLPRPFGLLEDLLRVGGALVGQLDQVLRRDRPRAARLGGQEVLRAPPGAVDRPGDRFFDVDAFADRAGEFGVGDRQRFLALLLDEAPGEPAALQQADEGAPGALHLLPGQLVGEAGPSVHGTSWH